MTALFVDHFRKIIRIQYASTSSFHNPKLDQEKCFMLQVYTGLFKECPMIASFVEQFKLNLENIRCIDFQCHVAKLNQ